MSNMSKGRGTPWYGKLQTASLPGEVKTIWYSRGDEQSPLPSWRWSFEHQTDMEHVEQRDLLVKILEASGLDDRHMLVLQRMVLDSCTLEDVGQELGVTKERVRQMEIRAIRRLRQAQYRFTGIRPWELHGSEVMTWQRWRWVKRRANRQ